MRIITLISLFDDTQNENLGDLERLQKVLTNLPDAKVIQKLKAIRRKGRNEWPVEAMWNSFIAGFVFDHDSIEFLCGFGDGLPTSLSDSNTLDFLFAL